MNWQRVDLEPDAPRRVLAGQTTAFDVAPDVDTAPAVEAGTEPLSLFDIDSATGLARVQGEV